MDYYSILKKVSAYRGLGYTVEHCCTGIVKHFYPEATEAQIARLRSDLEQGYRG